MLFRSIADQAVDEDTPWSFTVPAGTFSDGDGGPDPLTYSATLGNGDPLPAWLSFDPVTGTFTGTPPADFNGEIDLTVTASDGLASVSDTFTLTVTPVNDAPVAVDDSAAASQGVTLTVAAAAGLLANDTDVDGDTLVATAGTFATDEGGSITVNADGSYSYTAATGFTGTDTFTYTVSDGALSDTGVLTLTVAANEAPEVALAIADQAVDEDTPWSFTVPAGTFSDGDGGPDPLTYSATLGNGDPLPAWLSFDPVTGTFTGTPPADFNGEIDLTVTASDGLASVSDTFTLTVTPVNDAPVAVDDSAAASQGVTLTVAAAAGLLANDTDVDGDTLVATAGTFATDEGGSITVNADGSYSYTAATGFTGTDTFTYTVSDGALSDTGVLTLTVSPAAPVVTIDTDVDDDGVLVASEIDGETTVAVTVTLPDTASEGDTITLSEGTTPQIHIITAADIGLGSWATTVPLPANGATLNVTATISSPVNGTSPVGSDSAVVDSLDAVNDAQTLNIGNVTAQVEPEQASQDVLVLGLLESTGGTDGSHVVALDADYSVLHVEVTQEALVAVGDAYRIDIVDATGQIVASTKPAEAANAVGQVLTPLIGGTLGISGSNTVTVDFAGLAAGSYRVVVHNDASVLTNLLDADGNGISLQELGDSGVIVGAENQDVILDTVAAALDGPLLLGIDLGDLGSTVVRPLLEIVLDDIVGNVAQETPVSALVGELGDILSNPLVSGPLGLLGVNVTALLDALVSDLADTLLSNALTLLEQTDIATQVTAYNYDAETISGNAITDTGGTDVPGGVGATAVTQVTHGSTTVVVDPVTGATIAGTYGVLHIEADGTYEYTANGNPEAVGQTDVFTYTLADDATSDTATITIDFVDTTAPTQTPTIVSISDEVVTPGDWNTVDTSPTILGTLDAPLLPGERVQVQIGAGAWNDATTYGTDGQNWLYGPGALGGGSHTINVRIVDQAGNTGSQLASQAIVIDASNRAPIAAIDSGTLGGLVNTGALGLANIGSQAFVAYDPNKNLSEVVVRFDPLVGIGVNHLTWSTAVAAELGLVVAPLHNDDFILGTQDSTLTITASGGGAISNEAINELLRTVHLQSVLGVGISVTTTITATDGNAASDSDAVSGLANVGLLNQSSLDPAVILGGSGANTLNGTSANENLYGFAGDDIVRGGDGNDLLRGGQGADQLFGDDGNDVLIYDGTDATIDGGIGFDTLLVEQGTASFSLANVRNMEQITISSQQAVTATLTADQVRAATDADNQLIIRGDSNVQINLDGAVHNGQVLIGNDAYEYYSWQTAIVLIEDPISVTVF